MSTGEQKNAVYIHTIEYFQTKKRIKYDSCYNINEFEKSILSERHQSQKEGSHNV